MPKRSAEDKIDYYNRKIRKILKDQDRRSRRRVVIESESSENEDNDDSQVQIANETIPENTANLNMILNDESEMINNTILNEAHQIPELLTSEEPVPDPELLAALGESAEDIPEFGANIHTTLNKIWPPILKKGLSKDNKDKLLEKYLIPDNCRLLQAPKLNAEISSAVSDLVRNRDKKLLCHQQLLGSGITAINRGMDILLRSDNKAEALKHLSDSCRVLSDLHFMTTQYRIKLITPSLDKAFLNVVQDSDRDETLFGNNLTEKIKTSKTIEKQGLQIKKTVTNQRDKPATSTTTRPNQGNWSGPPRFHYNTQMNRGGRGTRRLRSAAVRPPLPYAYQHYQPQSAMIPPPPPPPRTVPNNKPRAQHQ